MGQIYPRKKMQGPSHSCCSRPRIAGCLRPAAVMLVNVLIHIKTHCDQREENRGVLILEITGFYYYYMSNDSNNNEI